MIKNIIACMLISFACVIPTQADLLLWMFDDPDIFEIDGSKVKTADLVGRGLAEGKQVNAVRVATVGSDGTKVYLDLFDSLSKFEYGNYVVIPTEWGGKEEYLAGPAYAELAGLDLNDTSRTFAMEIGYAMFEGDMLTEWIVMATGSDTYQNLREKWIVSNELSIQSGTHWTPIMAVPEPNSIHLILIGIGFIVLFTRTTRKNICLN